MRNFILLACVFHGFCENYAQSISAPIIPDFGKVYDMSNVTRPDADLKYKIVIDLKSDVSDPSRINQGLNNVARLLNLHGTGGIKHENLDVVVAIHGAATGTVMANPGYLEKYGVDNRNLQLIDQLKNANVELYVCGQSLIARGYPIEGVNPNIKIALSMLTVVTEHNMKGYSLLVFN